MIVLLDGGISRPLYAADLYKDGFAPEIWVSRPYRPQGVLIAVEAGVHIPANEAVAREILVKRGVPPESIRFYGRAVKSTINEALALKRAVETRGKQILVVTSRTHARRAGWIFRSVHPAAEIRVTATPYEAFTRRWWTSQSMAEAAVLETSKMVYYLLGGRFLSPLENTPHQL